MARKSGGMLKFGMLRESQHLQINAVDKARLEDLENWCRGIDGFGSLVMMAAKGL
jgi:hypothetical protein